MHLPPTSWLSILLAQLYICTVAHAAIAPPPWSDPNKNPCANMAGGWQLLYWAPLKQCFKIFQMGYPCPETMELSPAGGGMAECRCPPGTAQSPKSNECFNLFEQGPCNSNEYFAPVADISKKSAIPKQRWGVCKKSEVCPDGMLFWPKDSKCYGHFTKGPCAKGKLLVGALNKTAECKCENSGELAKFYYSGDGSCYEHFTIGPCQGAGDLFLPEGNCGCDAKLPHYHPETSKCYEIGSIGPCPNGHIFEVPDEVDQTSKVMAKCTCKEGYVLWNDGYCYRMYTKGPCNDNEFIINSTKCIKNPCRKGRLYFPQERTCYLIGSRGPCSLHKVVVFDFTTRPSIDGISYNGVCGCSGIISNLDQSCTETDPLDNACASSPGMVEVAGKCHKLYTRGPCGPGEWLELNKAIQKIRTAKCVCRPGHTAYESENGIIGCHAPSVGIARYLNSNNNYKSYTFAFRRYVND